ncbi:MAG: putative lipid II flippase FtsW [Candidatus Omnitrophica bacterium]|nr:putative lipid II flippase FtsW [Candidatus Omnitrophota bacterium]
MKQIRNRLAIITLLLLSFGLVMVYSASSIYAWENIGDSAYFLKRHIFFLIIGFLLTSLIMSWDYNRLRKFIKPLLILSIILLFLVLVPGIGKQVGGARRWFRILGVGFQPSELAGFMLILYLADFLSRKGKSIDNFKKGVFPGLLVLAVMVILLLLQPDLGTPISFILIWLIMFFVAGMKLGHLFLLFASGIPFLYLLIFSVPYRRKRILTFLNPWADPRGNGFQIIQAQIALGSGGIFGLGLGQSKQKLFYLPAAHTDFIFSIISEELGILGAAALIILFFLFLWQGIIITINAKSDFAKMLSFGLTLKIVLEVIINIGVNLGLFPTKGMPLPFVGYGGSSLVFDMLSVGLLLNIAKHEEDNEDIIRP